VNITEVLTRLKHVADQAGLPFGNQTRIYNSRLAQELGKWAETQDKGDAYHHAAFHAYFAEGKNIGKIPILTDLARSLHLSGVEAEKVLVERSFREAVDADWSFSRSKGVTAVPTLMLNRQSIVGAQPYGTLEKLMNDNQIRKRNP
jgi:predicted DsbA family dithiol-disulfide isomerase